MMTPGPAINRKVITKHFPAGTATLGYHQYFAGAAKYCLMTPGPATGHQTTKRVFELP